MAMLKPHESLLLDTHLLLWTAFDSSRLTPRAMELLNEPGNQLSFSSASIWEVTIKRALHKPGFYFDPALLRQILLDAGYVELNITSEHALRVGTLPALHKDPFDRLLLAQALVEGVTLVTFDAEVAGYGDFVELV